MGKRKTERGERLGVLERFNEIEDMVKIRIFWGY